MADNKKAIRAQIQVLEALQEQLQAAAAEKVAAGKQVAAARKNVKAAKKLIESLGGAEELAAHEAATMPPNPNQAL